MGTGRIVGVDDVLCAVGSPKRVEGNSAYRLNENEKEHTDWLFSAK